MKLTSTQRFVKQLAIGLIAIADSSIHVKRAKYLKRYAILFGRSAKIIIAVCSSSLVCKQKDQFIDRWLGQTPIRLGKINVYWDLPSYHVFISAMKLRITSSKLNYFSQELWVIYFLEIFPLLENLIQKMKIPSLRLQNNCFCHILLIWL